MLVTLYCDASFCSELGVGGWAVWLRSERGRLIRSGPTPPYCVLSGQAEMAAIYAGIYLATKSWPSTTAILVRSDSREALGLLAGKRSPSKEADILLMSKIAQIRATHPLRIIPRWVKGHRFPSSTDAYLNDKVDSMAHEVMRKQRRLCGAGTKGSS